MSNFQTVLDNLESFVEIAIFVGLVVLAVYEFDVDIVESAFYLVLAAVISPFSKIDRPAKRSLLVCGFIGGIWMGYFN